MTGNKMRGIARNIYHRLPISQKAKWALRSYLTAFINSVKKQPNAVGFVRGVARVVADSSAGSAVTCDIEVETAFKNILIKLASQSKQRFQNNYWIALPFLSTGGAEMVALNFCKAISELSVNSSITLFVTDRKLISKNILLPEDVTLICFDDYLSEGTSYLRKQALLRDLLIAARPEIFHNINSEVAWHLIINEGERLKQYVKLFASIFAFQFASDEKSKIGYAAYFLQKAIPHLSGLISDNQRFIADAVIEYGISESIQDRMRAIYQPCRLLSDNAYKAISLSSSIERQNNRPKILWAGRLDAEKRINLFFEVVSICEFADFYVYGQVVLESGVLLPTLSNLFVMGGFSSPMQWIEGNHYDAFMFTSKWEGMPNILLEVGALNIPVISPLVGGVSELINETTGYPLPPKPTVRDYHLAIQNVLKDKNGSLQRAANLRRLIQIRHDWQSFLAAVKTIPAYLESEESKHRRFEKFSQGIENENISGITVSIIIPCFNQGRYLYESVESALLSCTESMEIIIVDDGSTDLATERYLAEVIFLAPEIIRVHRQKNRGLSGARNTGLELARGDFIQFLDADDLLIPGKIDMQIAQLSVNNLIDVSVCNFLLCDDLRNQYTKNEEAIAQFDLTLHDFLYKWERGFAVPIHCGLFRRNVFGEIKFDTQARAKEDWLFWTELALHGAVFGYCHGHLAIYRQHPKSMRRSFMNMGKAWLEAGLKINSMLKDEEPLFFESVVSWFNQCYRSNSFYRKEIKEIHCAIALQKRGKVANNPPLNKPGDVPERSDCSIIAEQLIDKLKAIDQNPSPPLLSVIVPIYNHFNYLEFCLGSLSNQGNVAIEIICINDASPDKRVSDLMQSLTNKIARLKIINLTKNIGISEAQNMAVDAAIGEYLAFLDCDDLLESDALSSIGQFINSYPYVDYFFTDRTEMDEENQYQRVVQYGGYDNIKFQNNQHIKLDLLNGMVASHLKVIKRSTYKRVNGCNSEFDGVQDWDLALKIAEHGEFFYIDRPLYRHRIHSKSVTRSESVAQFRKTNLVRRLHFDQLSAKAGAVSSAENEVLISKDLFPVSLTTLKSHRENGRFCVADATGNLNIAQINFLREFNSYFDKIIWDNPETVASLIGYLWNPVVMQS